MIVVRTSESWPELRSVGEFSRSIELSYFDSGKKYLVQKIRTRQSALYILLENLPGIYEYSYTQDRRTRYVAHHSSILWVRTAAVSITACVQRSLAETRPLYSKRPCRRKFLCTYYILRVSKLVRCYENSPFSRHLVRRNLETRTRANRRHYMRPWIYGSRVGTSFDHFGVLQHAYSRWFGGQPGLQKKLERTQSHACLVHTISQENATLILTQISRDSEVAMRATLDDVVHVQSTACWRCCP